MTTRHSLPCDWQDGSVEGLAEPAIGTFSSRPRFTTPQEETTQMKSLYTLAIVVAAATPVIAAESMSSLPSDSWTVTNYYKQDVYD
jgi:hypothetical protein